MENYDFILVEDNKDDIELILSVMEEIDRHLKYLLLKTGEEAYQYFTSLINSAQPNPKLILLDLKLPQISGFEILEKIKSEKSTAHIPVVAFTSSKSLDDMHRSYGLGINAYVVKPIDFDEFSKAVGGMGKFWLRLNERP